MSTSAPSSPPDLAPASGSPADAADPAQAELATLPAVTVLEEGRADGPVQPFAERTVCIPQSPDAQAAVGVIAGLRRAGHSAFLVGGCVRDLMLGLDPKDYDVATSARPEEVAAAFDRVIEVGVAFGVVRVLWTLQGQWHEIEVATYRADGDYHDGRRPTEVRFTDAREDVLRRDFTLNGLLLDPLAASGGQVIDWVDGIADLERGHLRAIGEPALRFGEDALRLLRAVRFAARFGLHIEAGTAAAIVAQQEGLHQISRERVHAELVGMLKPPHAGEAVRLLAHLGLAKTLWPALVAQDPGLLRTERRMRALCDGVHWASLEPPAPSVVAAGAEPASTGADGAERAGHAAVKGLPFPLALAGFLWAVWPTGGPLPEEIVAGLRLSVAETRAVKEIWQLADALLALLLQPRLPAVRAGDPALARLLRAPQADAALRLLIAEADNVPAGWPHSARTWLRALRRLRMRTPKARWRPQLWVTGATLKALGYPPSPRFRVALYAAETVQLSGGTEAAALTAARQTLDDRTPSESSL